MEISTSMLKSSTQFQLRNVSKQKIEHFLILRQNPRLFIFSAKQVLSLVSAYFGPQPKTNMGLDREPNKHVTEGWGVFVELLCIKLRPLSLSNCFKRVIVSLLAFCIKMELLLRSGEL